MDIVSQVKAAIKLTKEKDYNGAGRIYAEILKRDKNNTTVLTLLGLLFLDTGEFKAAQKFLKKAHKLDPNNLTTIEALGFVMYNTNRHKEACKYFEKIIATTKNYEVYNKFIDSLLDLRIYARAYEIAIAAFEMFPLNKDILASLVYSCIYTGRFNEAIKFSNQLITAYPKSPESWLRQGLVQEVIFHNDLAALKYYKTAVKYGSFGAAYYNMAIIYGKLKDYKKALYCIKKVIKRNGLSANSCFILASTYFYQRKIKQGYKYYALKDGFKDVDKPVQKLKNLWDGKKYKDETLLVFSDQGIGDGIMFARYFPLLENRFKEIKITVYSGLVKLFRRSFKDYPKLKIYKYTGKILKSDKSVVMSNLPYVLKMETDFPFSAGYLKPDKKKANELKKKYFETDKLKVGVCWEAGSAAIRDQLNRTLPISLFEDIFKIEGIQFYSLQYKANSNDCEKYSLINLGAEFNDFDDTSAAIQNLDVMLTVDTSVAHLAGAMGVKTFMLLPYSADWRWFDDTKTTPWYDSMTIFKQTDNIFWDKEMNDIKHELKKML